MNVKHYNKLNILILSNNNYFNFQIYRKLKIDTKLIKNKFNLIFKL